MGKDLSGAELGEDPRPASIRKPNRHHVNNTSGREVRGRTGYFASGQKSRSGLEGLELHASFSVRPNRRWLPVEKRSRPDHPRIRVQEYRATRGRVSSGGLHNHGGDDGGGHGPERRSRSKRGGMIPLACTHKEDSLFAFTRTEPEGCARRSEHAGTAKLKGCQVRTTFRRFGNVASGRFWHVQRAPACRYALWRRAPLLGPPPWPPMVPTSAARRPIALRREPTLPKIL